MSDQSNDAGFEKPARKNQWQKGTSGNPRGRPRKHIAPITPREVRRVILELAFSPVPVSTAQGRKMMPAFRAAYMARYKHGVGGDFRSLKLYFDLFHKAIDDHAALYGGFPGLERLESLAALIPVPEEGLQEIDALRNQTRKNIIKPV